MENIVTFYKKPPKSITVNGEPIGDDEIDALTSQFADSPKPRDAAARSLIIRALLRQRAVALEVEAGDEESAIEKLLEREVIVPPVFDDEIRRFFDGNPQKFRSGDLFEVRHILFDTVGDVDKVAVIRKAEGVLLGLKNNPESFEEVARKDSCCSSGKEGGRLGQISPGTVVPEFWAALIGFARTGILPHLVETRFGHHIVLIDHFALGQALPFEAVKVRIHDYLKARLEQLTHQEYIAHLLEDANVTGIELGDQQPQPAGAGLPSQ